MNDIDRAMREEGAAEEAAQRADPDVLGVCSNCEQWIRRSNRNDCLNECGARGLRQS